MEFRKSLVISGLIHLSIVLIFPGFWFINKSMKWVEVSVIAYPSLEKSIPKWHSDKKLKQEPRGEHSKEKKTDLPVPNDRIDIGEEIIKEVPDIDTLNTEREYDFEESFEKIIPGRKDSEAKSEHIGEDNNFIISGPVTKRKLIRKVYPKYPAWAEEIGLEGEANLKFWVSSGGMVTIVELTRTSGYPDLDSRAIEAVKKYLFSPMGKAEKQEDQWGTITIKYTLK